MLLIFASALLLSGFSARAADLSSLYPVNVGYGWTYEVTNTSNTPCTPGTRDVVISQSGTVSGKASFHMTPLCPEAVASDMVVTDEYVDAHFYSGVGRLLEAPLQIGHQWNYWGSFKMGWKETTSVETPAGRFDNCWVAAMNTGASFEFAYCAGVGLAHFTFVDSKGKLEAILKSKNF